MTEPSLLGRFADLRVVHRAPMAELCTGHDTAGRPAVIVVLTPQAARDPHWSAEFADAVARDPTVLGPADAGLVAADLYGARPWAASLAEPGRRGAERLLAALPGAVPAGVDPSDLLPGPFDGRRGDPPSEAPVTSPMAGFGAPEYGPAGPVPGPSHPPPPVASPAALPAAPPAPPRHRTGLLIAAIAGATVLIMLVCGGAGLALRAQRGVDPTGFARPSAAGPPTPAPGESVPSPTGPSPTGPSPASPSSSATPTLRSEVAPATVVGPTFRAGEATYTMAFPGWPFAFRVPRTWGCIKGSFEGLPDALAWVCVDEGNSAARQKANVLLRRCPTTCTGPEQTVMDKVWFDKPEQAVRADAATRYVETSENAQGLYTVDMSHFFAPRPGQPLQWQVGVFVQSPPQTRAAVQKILNDVRAQTP